MDLGELKDVYVTLENGKRVLALSFLQGAYGMSDFGAFITETVANNQVFQGNVFTSRRILDIPAAGAEIVFDPRPSILKNKLIIVLPPSFQAVGGNELDITLFVASEYNGGTAQKISNRDQLSDHINDSVLFFNPTITSPGVESGIQWFLPSQSQGNVSSVGQASGDLPFRINPEWVQRLKVDNLDSETQRLSYNFSWFEIELGE